MGVDGTMYYGNAVVINPKFLSPESKQFLNEYFTDRDYDQSLISFDSYSDIDDQLITFWYEPPQQLFPGVDRRPLIIDDIKQLSLMSPNTGGPNLDDKDLWDPSYKGFDIMTLQYNENSRESVAVLAQVINRLTTNNMKELIPLIQTQEIRLIGVWLKYFLH